MGVTKSQIMENRRVQKSVTYNLNDPTTRYNLTQCDHWILFDVAVIRHNREDHCYVRGLVLILGPHIPHLSFSDIDPSPPPRPPWHFNLQFGKPPASPMCYLVTLSLPPRVSRIICMTPDSYHLGSEIPTFLVRKFRKLAITVITL